jgi:hypothetical protein
VREENKLAIDRLLAPVLFGEAATLLSAWPALALDQTIGDLKTCADWLQERSELKSWIKQPGHKSPMPMGTHITGAWLIGYLQGYDKGCVHDEPVTKGLDTDALFERLDRICRSSKPRPEDYFLFLAADELIKQLDPDHADICMQGLK